VDLVAGGGDPLWLLGDVSPLTDRDIGLMLPRITGNSKQGTRKARSTKPGRKANEVPNFRAITPVVARRKFATTYTQFRLVCLPNYQCTPISSHLLAPKFIYMQAWPKRPYIFMTGIRIVTSRYLVPRMNGSYQVNNT
jgi:hypothetical protein